MNILTKIGVVVLLALVLFTSAAMITKTVVDPNVKAQLVQKQIEAKMNESQAINNHIATLKAQRDLAEYRASADKKSEVTAGEISTLQGKLTEKDATIIGLTAQCEVARAQAAALPPLLATALASRNAADAALKELRIDLDQTKTELAEASKQLRTRDGEVQRYMLQMRSLENRIADLNLQIDKLGEQLSGRGPAQVSAIAPAASTLGTDVPKATGAVRAVQGDVASVTLGSAKGIKKDMVLTIFRGDKLVGTMRVTEVDAGESAGIIIDKVADVRQGDGVTTSLK